MISKQNKTQQQKHKKNNKNSRNSNGLCWMEIKFSQKFTVYVSSGLIDIDLGGGLTPNKRAIFLNHGWPRSRLQLEEYPCQSTETRKQVKHQENNCNLLNDRHVS